jgi:hypothetical protein
VLAPLECCSRVGVVMAKSTTGSTMTTRLSVLDMSRLLWIHLHPRSQAACSAGFSGRKSPHAHPNPIPEGTRCYINLRPCQGRVKFNCIIKCVLVLLELLFEWVCVSCGVLLFHFLFIFDTQALITATCYYICSI